MKFKLTKERKYLFIVIAIGIAYLLYQAYLFSGRTWENYPYVHQDFWRRMEDTQFYMGLRETGQFHPPLASILYIISLGLGITQIFGINFLVHFAFGILIYIICKRFTGNLNASLATTVVYYTNASIIQQANFLGLYDLLTCFLITLAMYIFLTRARTYKTSIVVGLILGISALIQYSGLFATPLLFLLILLDKNLNKKEKVKDILILGTTIATVAGSFFLYRFITFGDAMYSKVEQFGYLGINSNNFAYYIYAILGFFKVPFVLVALLGVRDAWKNSQVKRFIILLLPAGMFFILAYIWEDWRFVSYLIPIFYIVLCFGIVNVSKYIKKSNLFIPSLLIFSLFVVYNNFYTSGSFGIVLSPNKILKEFVSYSSEIPEHSAVPTRIANVTPYFLLNNNLDSRTYTDDELNYYLNTAGYTDVLEISKIIKDNKFLLFLENEQFVRFHQFSVAFKKLPVMNEDKEILAYKFIVSDKGVESKFFKELKTFGSLKLYVNTQF